MLDTFSENDYFWTCVGGGIIFFGILYSISMCFYDYSIGQKKEQNNDFSLNHGISLKNENRFINYTFVATKYRVDSTKQYSKGYCVNNSFNINNSVGLQQYQSYFSDPNNTLLLFEGNRIGLFLSKSELNVVPSLYDSLTTNTAHGYCTDVLKTTDSCSILMMDYIHSNKAWMLLSLPALLNVPIEDDEDNSMYPAEMVADAKSDWAQYILNTIDQEWDDGHFSESPNSSNLNNSTHSIESFKSEESDSTTSTDSNNSTKESAKLNESVPTGPQT